MGPHLTPLLPPNDEHTAVLAIEANTGIANLLRERFQKRFPNRFFVLNCAVSGYPLAGSVSQFKYYNTNGMSSSLSKAKRVGGWADLTKYSPNNAYGPGTAGFDVVAVLSLQSILSAIPPEIKIPLLKTDTQGHDFAVLKSASIKELNRIDKVISETYLSSLSNRVYEGVNNDLEKDWIPYMTIAGFQLTNPPTDGSKSEYDAVWVKRHGQQR